MTLWSLLVAWADRSWRDLSRLDWLLMRFKKTCTILFIDAGCFVDDSGSLFVQLVLKQLALKSTFWSAQMRCAHYQADDPKNSQSAKEALKALNVTIGGLFELIDATTDPSLLENAFRIFHCERWRMIFVAEPPRRARGAAAVAAVSPEDQALAAEIKSMFQKCHGIICKSRMWPETWLAFQAVAEYAVKEWLAVRPENADSMDMLTPADLDLDSKSSKLDELNLQCWRTAIDDATAHKPNLESERKKIVWYANLCATGTSQNERVLKSVNGVWRKRSSFMSRQGLEDTIILKCQGPKTIYGWVDVDKSDSAVLDPVGKAPVPKNKLIPTQKLIRVDARWRKTFQERYRLARKCPLHSKHAAKKDVSKKKVAARQRLVCRRIVVDFLKRKKTAKEVRHDETIFGMPRKSFMTKDIQALLAAHPKMQEVVSGFAKRFTKKRENEQLLRNRGKNAYEKDAKDCMDVIQQCKQRKFDREHKRAKTNTETKYYLLPVTHRFCVTITSGTRPIWKQMTLIRNAEVVVVNDLAFANVPSSGKIDDDLAMCMLLGLRIVLPGYLHVGGNKDGNDTSVKFVPAKDHVSRGVAVTEGFKDKHRRMMRILEMALVGNQRGWQFITEVDVASWEAAAKNVTILDSLNALANALRADSRHDRLRSAAGTFQKL